MALNTLRLNLMNFVARWLPAVVGLGLCFALVAALPAIAQDVPAGEPVALAAPSVPSLPAPLASASAPSTAGILDAPVLPPDAALAALAADPLNFEVLSRIVLNAVVGRNWGLLVAILAAALLAGLRRWIPATTVVGKWFASKVGIVIMNFALHLALMFATLFMSGGTLSAALILRALTMAVTASGTWSIYKSVAEAVNEAKAQSAGAAAPVSTIDK